LDCSRSALWNVTADFSVVTLSCMADDAHRLPPAPASLIQALRNAEGRLDELDALRADIHRLREALEAATPPDAEEVAGLVADCEHHSGTVNLTANGTLTASGVASGSASGAVEWIGNATGQAPPDPEAEAWLLRVVKKYGPAGYKIADLVLRAYAVIHGVPPHA